ncbi:hypothetical protein BGZ65_011030, partial [Modicella reniformis]
MKIVKNLKATDVRDLVKEYLSSPVVKRKNKDQETFGASIRVFLDLRQTPALMLESPSTVSYELLRLKYNKLCEKQKEQETT